MPDLERPDQIFAILVNQLLPVGLVGLIMAGLIAAIMSTISGALNSFTTIATIDFFIPAMRWWHGRQAPALASAHGEPPRGKVLDYESKTSRHVPTSEQPVSDAAAVFFGRITGIVALLVGVMATQLFALSDRPMFLNLLSGYGYFTPGITTMFLLGILWKRTTHVAALTVAVLTIPLSLTIEYMFPGLPFHNRTGIAFWTCMLVCVVVSLLTKPKRPEELEGLIWNRQSWRLPVDERRKRSLWQRPGFWWALVTAATLFFYVRYA